MNLTGEEKEKLDTALTDGELEAAAGGASGACLMYVCDLVGGCGRAFSSDTRPTQCPYCGSTNIRLM